jgi:mRNA interferase RelE/StbE
MIQPYRYKNKISYSKTFEKKFFKYDRKLQEKIFNTIQNLPNGNIKRL